MRLFKIIVIPIAVGVVGGFQYGTAMADESFFGQNEQSINQKIETQDGHVSITVPLKEKKGLQYEGIHLCKLAGSEDDMFFKSVVAPDGLSSGYSCINDSCTITLGAENLEQIPENIAMYVSKDGQCQKEDFETNGHIQTVGYEATIEFTDELVQALGIVGSHYSASSANNNGVGSWQMMGTKKANFSYGTKLTTDDLKIDDEIKAKINFI
jgi:hypothetical protein